MLASADVELDDFETIGMTHYAAGAGTLSSCRFAETVSYPLEFRASCDISAVSSVVMNGLAGGNGVMAASFDPDADIGGSLGAWRVSAVVPDASAPGGLSVSPPLSSALSTTEFHEVVPFQDGRGMLARTDLEGNFAWIRQDGPGPVFPVRETGCSAARATDSDVYMAFGEKVLEFGGTGRVETLTPIPTSIKLSCHRICDAPGGGLVTTTSGLYRLKQDRYGVRVSTVGGMSADAVGAVCQYGFSGGGFVYCDAAGRTLSSAKGRMFDEFMNVPAKINSVYARNKNEYYFGADDGIWRTVYSYELSNDTKVFTTQDVKVEYDDMTPDLSAWFEAGLSVHRETMHDGDSFATKLGRRVVGVRFENADLDAWTNVRRNETSGFSGNNDIVFETEFGN